MVNVISEQLTFDILIYTLYANTILCLLISDITKEPLQRQVKKFDCKAEVTLADIQDGVFNLSCLTLGHFHM